MKRNGSKLPTIVGLWICFAVAAQSAAQTAPTATEAAVVAPPSATAQALLATNLDTPERLVEVMELLVNLKEPHVAVDLMARLQGMATDDASMADLGRRVGLSRLYRLGDVREFQPQARQFAANVALAMDRQARSPERIAELIGKLQSPAESARVQAMVSLRAGHEHSAQALCDVIADPGRPAEHSRAFTALGALGADGIGPLELWIANGGGEQQVAAVKVLGYMDEPEAAFALYRAAFLNSSSPDAKQAASQALTAKFGKMPDPVVAAQAVFFEARKLYLRNAPTPTPTPAVVPVVAPAPPAADVAPGAEAPAIGNVSLAPVVPNATSVVVWRWDATAKKPQMTSASPRVAALDRAGQLAGLATQLAGNDGYGLIVARAAVLESALINAGPAEAARKTAADQWLAAEKPTAVDLERLVDFTAENNRTDTAVVLVRLLAESGGVQALESYTGAPSPLAKAAANSDRRVALAAAEEIVKLNPQTPFTGSAAVSEALGFCAASKGVRKALVLDINPGRAQDVAGMLAASGYRGQTVATPQEAVRIAAADPDVELVAMYRPFATTDMGQVYSQLRANYQTARVPVVVYCEPEQQDRIRSYLSRDPLAIAVHLPTSGEGLKAQLADLAGPASLAVVPSSERLRQARGALASMAALLKANNKTISIRRHESAIMAAAWVPALSRDAIDVLQRFPSAGAQRTLVDVADSQNWPLALRQRAAAAFCESVIQFNTLLTTGEIVRQYDRYNASERLDRPTQELLGAILDAIESRNANVPVGVAAPPSAAAAMP